jgi:hypothetical protein
MRIEINEIICQLYFLPTVKVTYDTSLNGRKELILCFLKWEFVFYK